MELSADSAPKLEWKKDVVLGAALGATMGGIGSMVGSLSPKLGLGGGILGLVMTMAADNGVRGDVAAPPLAMLSVGSLAGSAITMMQGPLVAGLVCVGGGLLIGGLLGLGSAYDEHQSSLSAKNGAKTERMAQSRFKPGDW